MAYNTSKGARGLGDIKNEDDVDTQIDFDNDKITFKTNDVARFLVDNDHVSGSGGLEIVGAAVLGSTLNVTGNVGIGTDSPDGKLHVWAASAGSVTVGGQQANGIIVEDDDSTAITLLDPNGGVIYFGDADDTDIGRIGYRHGGDYANSLYFTTNNAQRMTIDSSGKLGIGDPSPTHELTVAGAISGSSTLEVVGNTFLGGTLNVTGAVDAKSNVTLGDAAGDVTTVTGRLTGSQGAYFDGRVGIGTATPGDELVVSGTTGAVVIESNASSIASLQFKQGGTTYGRIQLGGGGAFNIENLAADEDTVFKVNDGGTTRTALTLNASDAEVVVNQGSDSLLDFRVEGDGQTHMLFVDGSDDKVGIKNSAPTHELTIGGNVSGSGTLEIVGNTYLGGTLNVTGASTFSSLTKTTAVSGSGGLQFVGPAILGNTLVVSGSAGTTPSIGLGTSTVHATENNYLSIANGTEPSFATADQISIGSKDSTGYGSGNGATLSINTEGLIENSPANLADLTHRVSVWINGTEYFLYLDPV